MSEPSNADRDDPHAVDDDVDVGDAAAEKAHQSELMDEALEETFPASDAPTAKHIT